MNIQKIIKTNYKEELINRQSVTYMLKELFSAIHNCDGCQQIIDRLNNDMYKSLRTVIDPEKKVLTIEDIEGFIRN